MYRYESFNANNIFTEKKAFKCIELLLLKRLWGQTKNYQYTELKPCTVLKKILINNLLVYFYIVIAIFYILTAFLFCWLYSITVDNKQVFKEQLQKLNLHFS